MAYTVANHIKNNSFKNIYLLYGKEDYLRCQFRDRLVNALMPQRDGMNFSYFINRSGKKNETEERLSEIMSICTTAPFFADKRVVVCENMGLVKNAFDDLLNLIPNIPDTTYFIIVEADIDKRKSLYKLIQKQGVAEEYDRPSDSDIIKWIGQRLKASNKTMDRDALSEFILRTGINMNNMDRELEKLICYCMDTDRILISHVKDVCTISIEEQIFNISNAIVAKDKDRALLEYAKLYQLQVEPRDILRILTNQFIQIMDTSVALSQGYSIEKIASLLGVKNSYAIKKRAESARLFNKKSLKRYIALSSETLTKLNTGLLDDRIGVEMYIISCISA